GGLDGNTQSHASGNGCHFLHRVRSWDGAHDDSMAHLVIGDDGLLSLRNQTALALWARHDTQDSFFEIGLANRRLSITRCQQSRLIQYISQVCTGETGS